MTKIQWVKSLQIGDEVCDCCLNHQKIVGIWECYEYVPAFIRRSYFYCLPLWVPDRIDDLVYNTMAWPFKFLGYRRLLDKDLILEDGSHCSAMSCCDPADHKWKHPEK